MKNHRTIDWLSFYYLHNYVNKRMNDVFGFTFIYTSYLHLQYSLFTSYMYTMLNFIASFLLFIFITTHYIV